MKWTTTVINYYVNKYSACINNSGVTVLKHLYELC